MEQRRRRRSDPVQRLIVEIDEAKCDGCGDCVPSCAEGAIQIVGGKARLVGDALCDGLGACLGECPQGAIRVVTREAAPFDEVAVAQHLGRRPHPEPGSRGAGAPSIPLGGAACLRRSGRRLPGRAERRSRPSAGRVRRPGAGLGEPALPLAGPARPRLSTCPVAGRRRPPAGRRLRPFAYPDFHRNLLAGRTGARGLPKLDDVQAYVAKLAELFRESRPRSLTVARMEVPCCGGIAWAAHEAVRLSGVAGAGDRGDGQRRRCAPLLRRPMPVHAAPASRIN